MVRGTSPIFLLLFLLTYFISIKYKRNLRSAIYALYDRLAALTLTKRAPTTPALRAPTALVLRAPTALALRTPTALALRATTTPTDPRATLESAARAHGWNGLNAISLDAFMSLGTLRNTTSENEEIFQGEITYITQFVSHIFLGVLLRNEESVVSTGVLQDLSANLARTRQLSFGATIPPSSLVDTNEAIINFIVTTTSEVSILVLALIHQVDENPEVGRAFYHFAQNPTSWDRYTHRPGDSELSIEERVRRIHRAPGSSFRVLTVARRPSHSRSEGPHSPFANAALSHGDTMRIGVEAGIGRIALGDGEIEYLAALFVAALMRFHAGDYGGSEF